MKEIFSTPYKVYSPKEVRQIRTALGKSTAEFADMFVVSVSLVEAWESSEKAKKHRELYGPAARLMNAAAEMAKGKTSNLIRMAAKGEL